MASPGLYWPSPPRGASVTDLDDWFAITHDDARITVADVASDADSDSEYVLVLSEGDTESEIVHLAPPRSVAVSPVHAATPAATPTTATPSTAPRVHSPRLINLNERKACRPGLNAAAERECGDRWVGLDAKLRKGRLRYLRINHTRHYHVASSYPLADVVFRPTRQNTPVPAAVHRRAHVHASMTVRIVDAGEELARRLAHEGQDSLRSADLGRLET
ncbi:hypothetical protein CC85DRAFT_301040 [Cutaneotrichosporon oleaginosum]|uniref:Uncharacterized protein n=1 Tax=Cutaneotrichosporon oleaginosum TaxID=879819 RepID=A0A0J0XS06_9TREE|nr:uncharacterized protein CC85DRAFT_301040 [Cutaneotrichosporon oleaginosum]KLT43872.1 hypothetical protein CC85DRAFT_301040 [Cutaneotrichosporon oleaginosum]TXT06388.1 hypothetical protein COLE_05719 [Cutaneotrichosporon oleaginosum]